MIHNIAIFESSAPSLSPEQAARSFYAERVPLAPPPPDRDFKWRWGVAILAALLLHFGVITTIDDGFQRNKPTTKTPVPVEIVTEPPAPPPPTEKPAPKPPPEPPQQPKADLSSGGDLANKAPGVLPPTPTEEKKPPSSTPTESPPQPQPPAPAPALPTEASPQAVPVPPAAAPRSTQQAMVPLPVPPKKPPTPTLRQSTSQTMAPTQSDSATSTMQDLRRGEGGGDKYLNALREDILRHIYYPPTAEMFKITGIAVYDITIDRKGRLLNARLIQSSGYDILDKAGFMTLNSAAPFDPVPADFAPERSTISLTLSLSMGPS